MHEAGELTTEQLDKAKADLLRGGGEVGGADPMDIGLYAAVAAVGLFALDQLSRLLSLKRSQQVLALLGALPVLAFVAAMRVSLDGARRTAAHKLAHIPARSWPQSHPPRALR